uniref:Secreted protein n=1 Tax=Ascaris lumbricoides TaxID=6252 RepID=A0A0M3HVY0_ASCLU
MKDAFSSVIFVSVIARFASVFNFLGFGRDRFCSPKNCNDQTCRTLTRSTRQKKTISLPVEHTYTSPWRQHTQASTTQKILTKVLPRGILKGGGDQTPRSVSLNPPVRENTGPVKREGPCASNVERRGESAWKKPGAKQIEVKKNGLSAILTPINRFRERSPNVTIPRKPEQKNESRSVPDRATGNGINKPSTPNVGCNSSEMRAIRSAGLSGARTQQLD